MPKHLKNLFEFLFFTSFFIGAVWISREAFGPSLDVWLPAGVVTSGMAIRGTRLIPAVVCGLLISQFTILKSPLTFIPYSVASDIFGILITVQVMKHHVPRPLAIRIANFWGLFGGFSLYCAVSATIGVFGLCQSGRIAWHAYLEYWFIWYIGNLVGAFIIHPGVTAVFYLARGHWNRLKTPRAREAMAWVLFMILMALANLYIPVTTSIEVVVLDFLPVFILGWSATRLPPSYTMIGITLICLESLLLIKQGPANFLGVDTDYEIRIYTLFITGKTLVALILAYYSFEIKQFAAELTRTNRNLEEKVVRRTAELKSSNDDLAHLDEIIKRVTQIREPREIFDGLLREGSLLFQEERRGLLFVLEKNRFIASAAVGGPWDEAKTISLTPKQVKSRYMDSGEDWGDGIYHIVNQKGLPAEEIVGKWSASEMISMFIEGAEGTVGVMVWDVENAALSDTRRLRIYRDHAAIALNRARFLMELQRKNQEISAKNEALIKAQDRLVVNEKMAALGTLTAGIAHEFNNPNNFISGGLQNLENSLANFKDFLLELAGEEADTEVIARIMRYFNMMQDHVDTAYEGSRRIGEVVENMSMFSSLNRTKSGPADICEGLRTAVNLIRSQYHQIQFKLDLDGPMQRVCQAAKLNLAWTNVLLNGCEAILERRSNEGSRAPALLYISAEKSAGEARVVFRDSGTGIPEECRDRIFEAFFTTRDKGVGRGLGLYSTWNIIKKHNGRIEVDSKPGKGTRMTFYLPLDEDRKEAAEPVALQTAG
ncbi:MAG: ATP-binding protein [Acidobacteriota bacterium]|nr:ATP-binding protein [Acidobacteriota bacterium]